MSIVFFASLSYFKAPLCIIHYTYFHTALYETLSPSVFHFHKHFVSTSHREIFKATCETKYQWNRTVSSNNWK